MNLRKSNEAVSPVIGVILMVAITVVLAAVVFIVVSRIHVGPNELYSIGVNYAESDHSFTIINSPNPAFNYGNLTVKDNGVTQSIKVNGLSPVASQLLSAGDKITLVGLSSGQHSVSFVVHDQVVFSRSFSI